MYLYLIFFTLGLLSQLGPKNLEQAIVSGDFAYINKNLQTLTAQEKTAYLEVSNKQLALLSEQSKSYWPNKWDTITLLESFLFLIKSYQSLVNLSQTVEEKAHCYKGARQICLDLSKSNNNQITFEKLWESLNNPARANQFTKSGDWIRRALIDFPEFKSNYYFDKLILNASIAYFFAQRAWGSHYKNLNIKNRLSIHQLIEKAPIQEKAELPEKEQDAGIIAKINKNFKDLKQQVSTLTLHLIDKIPNSLKLPLTIGPSNLHLFDKNHRLFKL